MIQKPRGTKDLFGSDYLKKKDIEDKFVSYFSSIGFEPMETPIFEQRNLFVRSVGDGTDIVEKELFDLEKKSDEIYSLRPELTAGMIRSLIESGLKGKKLPVNVFSIGECFRYEKPQKGRFRQFNQLDIEMIGVKNPQIDAYGIYRAVVFLKTIGIENICVNINSLGSTDTKTKFSATLTSFLEQNADELCEDCKRRMKKNPLRALDCKNPRCSLITKKSPSISDSLTDEEKKYFESVIEILEKVDVKIKKDDRLVRGLDYYTGVIFELSYNEDKERQGSIGGGGRYDELIQQLDGPNLPAFGFGFGLERLLGESSATDDKKSRVMIIALSEKEISLAFEAQNAISGLCESEVYQKNYNLANALSDANKSKFDYIFIIGDNEAKNSSVLIKNLSTGRQIEQKISDLAQFLG